MNQTFLVSAFVVPLFFSTFALAFSQDQTSGDYVAAGVGTLPSVQADAANMPALQEIYNAASAKGQANLGKHCKLETVEQFEQHQKKVTDPELLMTNEQYQTKNSELGMYVGVPLMQTAPSKENCFMNDREMSALRMYTGSFYRALNFALRNRDKTELKRFRLVTKYILSALGKLKNYVGYVKRGSELSSDELSKHQVGATVPYPAFTSTSVGTGFFGKIRYVIYSKTCKYIAPFSDFAGEEEVLCLPGTQFRIRYRQDESGTTKLLMEEVAQSFDIDQLIQSL